MLADSLESHRCPSASSLCSLGQHKESVTESSLRLSFSFCKMGMTTPSWLGYHEGLLSDTDSHAALIEAVVRCVHLYPGDSLSSEREALMPMTSGGPMA